MSAPPWLQALVEDLVAGYGLPAPAVAPRLIPETGGRGVLLADPSVTQALGNASTVRLMAPLGP
jgi:hypothetical protein